MPSAASNSATPIRLVLALGLCFAANLTHFSPCEAAEIAVLSEATWAEFAPGGKEVDAIYGDIALRNDKLVAVVANPIDGRNANMTMKNAGGCLIDFTTRAKQNDQFGTFFPLGKATNWRTLKLDPTPPSGSSAGGTVVSVRTTTVLKENELTAETTYVLSDGADYLVVGTKLTNLTDKPIHYAAKDETSLQGSYVKGTTGELSWSYDRWWDAAYGMTAKPKLVGEVEIPAKESLTLTRRWYVASDLNSLQHLTMANDEKERLRNQTIAVAEGIAVGVTGAYVEITDSTTNKLVTAGKTNDQSRIDVLLGEGSWMGKVSSPSHAERTFNIPDPESTGFITLEAPGHVVAAITDADGGPISCKVQFRGIGDTKDPEFFDKTGENAVGNLYYSHDGKFEIPLPPGNYDCTISHGTEYDAAYQKIEVGSGRTAKLNAKLIRSMQTPGWISADFHNHASPSGDNSSSQFGRVLNLLAEHVEFAPCTEHNRVSTYLPHLQRLKAEHLMATCSGIELTGSPLPTNHHNAFPIKLHHHHQDGGGPTVETDAEVNVERLALWDDRSRKIIQQNHPDIGHVFFDKNGDGVPDGGMQRKFGHIDCIEIHPPHLIFAGPTMEARYSSTRNNPMFNWLQLLNQGFRIPGIVNTDAHYNIHGSGWLRTYIKSKTDDPAKIEIADMIHEAEHGHMVMTNGPFLEVSLSGMTETSGPNNAVGPGDEIHISGGKVRLHVRVQCPNWFDVDRVQVFINGRPDPKQNYTRAGSPDHFSAQTVKFDRDLPLELAQDSHLVVAVIGESSALGHVMGPEHADDKPVAVANPIYVDIDGNGFQANKDTLGVPLPVKAPDKKK